MSIGVNRRLSRIIPRQGSLILPLDGAFIDGPVGALNQIENLLSPDLVDQIDSILGYVGLLKRLPECAANVPFIANMSGSTYLRNPSNKIMLSDVSLAANYGADAVCFQLHLTDVNEQSMFRDIRQVITEAARYGMPVLITAYPRCIKDGKIYQYESLKLSSPTEYTELVAHSVRVAVELGADIVKTVYPGSYEAMVQIVKAAMGVPIVIAGGEVATEDEIVTKAQNSVRAGGFGVAYGRQIYMSESPTNIARIVQLGMKSLT